MNAPAPGSGLSAIQHVVQLMLENRSFDHMLGFLYAAFGNKSPTGADFEGLTGQESNPDTNGNPVKVFEIDTAKPNAYFMPGADPGEGSASVIAVAALWAAALYRRKRPQAVPELTNEPL